MDKTTEMQETLFERSMRERKERRDSLTSRIMGAILLVLSIILFKMVHIDSAFLTYAIICLFFGISGVFSGLTKK